MAVCGCGSSTVKFHWQKRIMYCPRCIEVFLRDKKTEPEFINNTVVFKLPLIDFFKKEYVAFMRRECLNHAIDCKLLGDSGYAYEGYLLFAANHNNSNWFRYYRLYHFATQFFSTYSMGDHPVGSAEYLLHTLAAEEEYDWERREWMVEKDYRHQHLDRLGKDNEKISRRIGPYT